MKLNDARFCVDCEELFEGTACPKCGRSESYVCLSDWLKSLNSPEGMVYLVQRIPVLPVNQGENVAERAAAS